MKKVLALVLALTMVLGFAATASASYFGNYIKYDFFKTAPNDNEYKVGGSDYYDGIAVDGNKEYKVKLIFNENQINPFFGNTDSVYDNLYQEYRVLEAIQSYAANNFYQSKDWTATADLTADAPNNIHGRTNLLWEAVYNIVGSTDGYAASTIYKELVDAVVDEGNFRDGYNSSSFQSAKSELERAWNNYYNNGYYGYDKGISVTATSKDETYATITSAPTVSVKRTTVNNVLTTQYTVEFKVKFTNTTFRTADVDLEVVYNAGGAVQTAYYESKHTLEFTVYQAQYRTFTAQDATIAFGVTPNVEISADDYAYISADAFRLMLQNSNRSITVVSGMGDSKVRFDSDSTNLPQDVFVGNFATKNTGTTAASISGFSSTTAAKVKIAVGKAFYDANVNKTISVFDANGNKLDVEATLQGDYTVNFFAPLSNYTVSSSDWAGQNTNTDTDSGKTNPSMGGAL